MENPVNDSRLYTLIKHKVPEVYDSGFAEAMKGLHRG